jgi:hypothetical protein
MVEPIAGELAQRASHFFKKCICFQEQAKKGQSRGLFSKATQILP